MKIKAIFLDLGGVVIGLDWNKTFDFLGIKGAERREETIRYLRDSEHLDSFERGRLTMQEFYSRVVRDWDLKVELSQFEFAWNLVNTGLLPGVDKIFERFTGQVPLYALSNTNKSHVDYLLRMHPIMQKFTKLFTSFDMGCRKPEREMFVRAAESAGAKPNEIVYFDDLTHNVLAAKQLGFHAYQTVNSPADTLRVLETHFA